MAAEEEGGVPEEGSVRGYIDGCFDIMHSGHYNAIRQAKGICDVLVVGVHSDLEIEENKSLPVMRQAERYALLEHIKWIDEIVHDVPYSPQLATLERARADFCIHGDDMPVNAQGVCAYDGMKDAGKLRIIKRTEGVSTTDLIGRLLTLSRHQHNPEHRWQEIGASSSGGVKVQADAAIELGLGAAVAPAPPSLAAALGMVERITKAYSIGAAETQELKALISNIAASSASSVGGVAAAATALPPASAPAHLRDGAPPAAKRPKTDANNKGEAAQTRTRTQVPVQLLASTRRITEFSSGRQPAPGDRIVYVCGSFDMFHVGHAQFLKDARALGTFLFVGIHDDLAVSAAKGVNYPVMTLNERVLNVCACKWVDEVIIGAPKTVTQDLIKTWNIQVVAKGSGHLRDEGAREARNDFAVPEALGIYKEVPSKWPNLCRDTVVQRIIAEREVYLRRNRDRAAREDTYYLRKDQNNSPLEV